MDFLSSLRCLVPSHYEKTPHMDTLSTTKEKELSKKKDITKSLALKRIVFASD